MLVPCTVARKVRLTYDSFTLVERCKYIVLGDYLLPVHLQAPHEDWL